VHLERIETPQANITWRFRGDRAGFFGTQLLITPHGPDFEYFATGGKTEDGFASGSRSAPRASSHHQDAPDDLRYRPGIRFGSAESIHAQGNAGIGQDKSVDLRANFNQVQIHSWLPAEWKEHLAGSAFGVLHWAGKDVKLENSAGEGSLAVNNGRIDNLPFLEKLAELSQEKSFEHLALTDCSLSFGWKYPKIDIENIVIEERGKFRIEGEMSIEQRRLRGTIRLGLKHEYLDWLPNPEEVFSRKQGGYLWTNVRLSGTIDEPGQDLSPRIIELLNNRPELTSDSFFASLKGG
jgi:hypothetical protein